MMNSEDQMDQNQQTQQYFLQKQDSIQSPFLIEKQSGMNMDFTSIPHEYQPTNNSKEILRTSFIKPRELESQRDLMSDFEEENEIQNPITPKNYKCFNNFTNQNNNNCQNNSMSQHQQMEINFFEALDNPIIDNYLDGNDSIFKHKNTNQYQEPYKRNSILQQQQQNQQDFFNIPMDRTINRIIVEDKQFNNEEYQREQQLYKKAQFQYDLQQQMGGAGFYEDSNSNGFQMDYQFSNNSGNYNNPSNPQNFLRKNVRNSINNYDYKQNEQLTSILNNVKQSNYQPQSQQQQQQWQSQQQSQSGIQNYQNKTLFQQVQMNKNDVQQQQQFNIKRIENSPKHMGDSDEQQSYTENMSSYHDSPDVITHQHIKKEENLEQENNSSTKIKLEESQQQQQQQDNQISSLSVKNENHEDQTNSDQLREMEENSTDMDEEMEENSNNNNNQTIGCNCKKSKCLKLYCECFANQGYCVEGCNCSDCRNKPEFEEEKQKAIQEALGRNPAAFLPKSQLRKNEENKKGCSCKKTKCLKKYCECYNSGIACTSNCVCVCCENTELHIQKRNLQKQQELKLQQQKQEQLQLEILQQKQSFQMQLQQQQQFQQQPQQQFQNQNQNQYQQNQNQSYNQQQQPIQGIKNMVKLPPQQQYQQQQYQMQQDLQMNNYQGGGQSTTCEYYPNPDSYENYSSDDESPHSQQQQRYANHNQQATAPQFAQNDVLKQQQFIN